MPAAVQRRRSKGWRMPPNCVSVTRPGKYGNPFKLGDQCPTCDSPLVILDTPKKVVKAFREYAEAKLVQDPHWLEPLRGIDLACFCSFDQPCHRNVLLELANRDANGCKWPITNRKCESCGRREGSTKDRSGDEDGVPLGELEKCKHCGRMACPDCHHERDCCTIGEDDE